MHAKVVLQIVITNSNLKEQNKKIQNKRVG